MKEKVYRAVINNKRCRQHFLIPRLQIKSLKDQRTPFAKD